MFTLTISIYSLVKIVINREPNSEPCDTPGVVLNVRNVLDSIVNTEFEEFD